MFYALGCLALFLLIGVLPQSFWEKTKSFFSFINDFCTGIKNIFSMFGSVLHDTYEFLISPFKGLGNFVLALLNMSDQINAQQAKENEKMKEEDINLRKEIGEIWIAIKTGTAKEKEAAKQRLVPLAEKHGEEKINLFLKEAQSM